MVLFFILLIDDVVEDWLTVDRDVLCRYVVANGPTDRHDSTHSRHAGHQWTTQ